MRVHAGDDAEVDDGGGHIRRLGSEARRAQIGGDVILLELGDHPNDAAITGDEVPLLAEPPEIPLQIRKDRDRDRENHTAE